MAKIVRDSKFRHVFSEAHREKYDDVRPSSKPSESVGVRCNGKWIAVAWESGGGGSLAVFSSKKIGRLPRDLPLISGHSGAILDFDFNPFDDDMLATASEDTTVKIWQLPEDGMKAHMKEPAATLNEGGHEKKVSFCCWNPVASGILASTAFDQKLKIWNIEEQAVTATVDAPDQAWSLKWNYNGSLLSMACKDKKMHIVDPRKKEIAFSSKVHDGSKGIKMEWMGRPDCLDDTNKIITTGFSQQAERQIGVWDLRKFGADSAEPLNMVVLDQGIGILLPCYDAGTGMAFFAGKGDANVRYFEMDNSDPYIHFISQYGGKEPSKGFDWVPKRCLDTTKHESMRGMQLQANSILPISFKVPRKSENFQEDIYPDCPSGEACMTADDWVNGSECKPPKTQSMNPGRSGERRKTEVGMKSVKDLKKELEEANKRIKELEEENAKLKEELAAAKS